MAQASFIVSPCSLPLITDFTNWVSISFNDYVKWVYKVRLAKCLFNATLDDGSGHTSSASLSMPMPVGGSYETSFPDNTSVNSTYFDYCGSYEETKLACGGIKSCQVSVDGSGLTPNNPNLSGIADSHNYTADEITSLWSLTGWPDIFFFTCIPRFGVDYSGNIYFDMNPTVQNSGSLILSTTPFDGATTGTATFLPFPPSEYFQTIYFSGATSITFRVQETSSWSYSA